MVEAEAVVDLDLCMTRSSRGITTAAAMMMSSMRSRRKKPQQGRPQQRRRFGEDFSFRPAEEGSAAKGEGQGETVRVRVGVTPSRGVARPGGGKAASMPERPEWRFSSDTFYI